MLFRNSQTWEPLPLFHPWLSNVLKAANNENNKSQTELTVTRKYRVLIGAAVVAERDAVIVSVRDLEPYVRLFLD